MGRLVFLTAALLALPSAAQASPGDFAVGSGSSGLQFQFVAHGGSSPGSASGHMRISGDGREGQLDFRAEVTCLNVGAPVVNVRPGTAARIEGRVLPGAVGATPGEYFDLDVIDSPAGDLINFAGSGPVPICLNGPPLGFGGALERGAIVVRS